MKCIVNASHRPVTVKLKDDDGREFYRLLNQGCHQIDNNLNLSSRKRFAYGFDLIACADIDSLSDLKSLALMQGLRIDCMQEQLSLAVVSDNYDYHIAFNSSFLNVICHCFQSLQQCIAYINEKLK